MEQSRVYLKGLNSLRAIAAISVVIFHINMSFKLYGLKTLGEFNLAGFGVTIFFSLSGFLITYLLLKEKESQTVDIKKFYMRRILRIWPLYFLVLFLSLLTAWRYYPESLPGSLYYYLFFAANIPFLLDIGLPFLGHFWSVGVEEQFYLFWPWTIRNTEKTLRFVTGFFLVFFLLRILARLYEIKTGNGLFYLAIHITRFDCMAIGALGAILFHQRNELFLKMSTNKVVQLGSWLVIFLLMFNKFHIASVMDHEIVSVVTVMLIINLSQNPFTLISMDNRFFDFLGKISYGIYLIHQLVIFYLSLLLNQFMLDSSIKYPLVYCSVLSITIFLSYLSYEFFEKKFLKLKENYSIVKSSLSKESL